MKNKIKRKIINMTTSVVKWLFAWLYDKSDVVVNARPIHRDIHLNSPEAITVWLAMVDRPLVKYKGVTLVYNPSFNTNIHPDGGGASLNKSE